MKPANFKRKNILLYIEEEEVGNGVMLEQYSSLRLVNNRYLEFFASYSRNLQETLREEVVISRNDISLVLCVVVIRRIRNI